MHTARPSGQRRTSWPVRPALKWVLCTATAASLGLVATAPAWSAEVVTNQLVSESSHQQVEVPITFGQVFRDGDVPRGATVTATLDGHPVALQVDAKATNADGSLRHAVLTAQLPQLAGRAKVPLALAASLHRTTQGQAVSLAQLLATPFNASITLNLKDGSVLTADARSLLQRAARQGSCKPWNRYCNLWLAGPLVSEWVVNGALPAPHGRSGTNLTIYFAVRAYAGKRPGTIGRVRTDIVIENSNAFAPQAQPQYTATLASGSATYTSPALTQYTATRWHHVLWWNGDHPAVYVRQDTQYIQRSRAISRYMRLTPDTAFLARQRQTCPPLATCDQTQKMHMTGAQAAIGPLPRWTSVYILDPDVRAYHWMLANTDALGAYSIHYRDSSTGYPVSIVRRPDATVIAWASYRNEPDQLPGCSDNAVVTGCSSAWYGTGNPAAWDNAHQPAEAYVPYMVTGSWYDMSELAFGASHNELWSNPAYRGYAKGLIDDAHSQVRGKAWVLREMADAAWLLPDAYPLKAEFNADVRNSLADWNAKYTHNPNANPLHVTLSGVNFPLNGGTRVAMPPWEHSFFTWSAGHAAELGFAGAAALRDWLGKFDIGLITGSIADRDHGYCWLEASKYLLQVKDNAGRWLPTFSAVYAANFPSLDGLACNSPRMVAAVAKLEKQPWKAGQMVGYADSATGFPSNLQIGLAAIADSGLPGAAAAWRIFTSRSVQPDGKTNPDPNIAYRNYPNFAIIPRTPPDRPAKP